MVDEPAVAKLKVCTEFTVEQNVVEFIVWLYGPAVLFPHVLHERIIALYLFAAVKISQYCWQRIAIFY